jgi:hypothetical protein
MIHAMPHIVISVLGLILAIVIAAVGTRPHQLYAETWQGRVEAVSAASAPAR